jgi:RimJ/RimL family protein N-acetyltransferase
MENLPSFETARLCLRARTMDDFEACLAMDCEPGITQYIRGPWDDPARHKAFLRDRITADYGSGLGYWSVFAKDHPDRFIGWMLLIPEDAVGPDIEIGWRFVAQSHGKGYATEAARVILAHAFDTLKLPRIVADIDPRNAASIRVAQKIGMRPGPQLDGPQPDRAGFHEMTSGDFVPTCHDRAGDFR